MYKCCRNRLIVRTSCDWWWSYGWVSFNYVATLSDSHLCKYQTACQRESADDHLMPPIFNCLRQWTIIFQSEWGHVMLLRWPQSPHFMWILIQPVLYSEWLYITVVYIYFYNVNVLSWDKKLSTCDSERDFCLYMCNFDRIWSPCDCWEIRKCDKKNSI